jgi:predicted transcriptional regulator of viral defense system
MTEILFETFGTGKRVLMLLKSKRAYGGPQSLDDVCKNLQMNNRNARSILSRLCLKGEIDRIGKALYRAKGDDREYDPSKPHYK